MLRIQGAPALEIEDHLLAALNTAHQEGARLWADVDEAACFWSQALGRPLDPDHPSSRGNYRMLQTPPDEPIVEIQRVEHESRVHIDIETDNIPAESPRRRRFRRRATLLRPCCGPLPAEERRAVA
ncbi:MAG: hypothetical protein JO122_20700 [Acetobacteraceae bacterium]|nr:hypothetical protein [Acetobacteraceae bacterium]